MLISKLYEMEEQMNEKDEKCKEQSKINSELADKIQQLEFDKDMLFKENENIKKREYDFGGLLDSGEMEAQIQFKDQEIIEYKQKLNEERTKNNEYVAELKEEISQLQKAKMQLQNNTQDKKLIRRFEKENMDLTSRNHKYEQRIMELQNLLTKDSDKLTQAKELEQMENVIKQITNQLKKVKQESHFQLLEL